MAKRKKQEEQAVDAPAKQTEQPKPKEDTRTPAERFAGPRRVPVLNKAEGEQLVALLVKSGYRLNSRGEATFTQYAIRNAEHRFVVDLTK